MFVGACPVNHQPVSQMEFYESYDFWYGLCGFGSGGCAG